MNDAGMNREHSHAADAGGAAAAPGPRGAHRSADLAHCALREALVPIGKETRRTVAVVDQQAGDVTMFNEAGPTIASEEWSSFVGHYWKLLAPCSAVVLAGSLPPGLPQDAYATL